MNVFPNIIFTFKLSLIEKIRRTSKIVYLLFLIKENMKVNVVFRKKTFILHYMHLSGGKGFYELISY